MKNAVIVHGMPSRKEYETSRFPSPSNSHWLPWLQRELLRHDILAQTPEFPTPYDPNYSAWSSVLSQFELTPESILVGHSCGAGFLVRWLSEHGKQVRQLVLVAPWIDPNRQLTNGFFDFDIDQNVFKTLPIKVLVSDDDDVEVLDSVAWLKDSLPTAHLYEFHGKGHFTEPALKSTELPELLDILNLSL